MLDYHFIACHHVSPQETRRRTEKWKRQKQKQGKAPNPRGKRGHRHANGKPHARKNGRKRQERHETGKEENCIMQS